MNGVPMNHRPIALLVVALTGACASSKPPVPHEETAISTPAPTVSGCESRIDEVRFDTSDGVTLVADHHIAAEPGKGAVVLLHMIPPSWDRSSYPPRVRRAIADLGPSVLNVDRRGAGASGGVAEDAYVGPGGLADVEAAVRFLTAPDAACPIDPAKLVIVAASNGTTSALDYAVAADASLPRPAAMVWMSPGTYTESQNRITDHRAVLDEIPLLWLYPTNEPYSDDFTDSAPSAWSFVQRGEVHGTQMFDGGTLEEATMTDLIAWVESGLN